MKKALSILLIIAVIGGFVIGASAVVETSADQSDEITVEVNNRKLNLSKPAFMVDNVVMVPLKDVFVEMGASIDWRLGEIFKNQRINVVMNELSLFLYVDRTYMDIFDKEGSYRYSGATHSSVTLDTPVRLVDGEVFIPISAFEHIRTVNMKWNQDTRTVSLTHDILSRLNGVWVDEAFVDFVGDGGIVANGKPVMFSVSDEKLEHILLSATPQTLKLVETAQGQTQVPLASNSRLVIENTDEIQMIKYISREKEHILVRFSSYEMMVQKLTADFNWSYYFYSDSMTNESFSIVRLLIKEAFTYNEDMIEVRTYDGQEKTFIFEYGPSFSDPLKLYEITNNNQKGELKHILSGNTVARSFDDLPPEWENPFSDISPSDWFYNSVEYVVTNSIFTGTSETAFEPDASMTRAMFVTALWRLAEKPAASLDMQFNDVQQDAYYAKAVQWAAENEIISGTGDGRFAADVKISRQDICVILARYMEYMGATHFTTDEYKLFTDENEIADYAKNEIKAMNRLGIIYGKVDKIIDPRGASTRAEVAAMLHRFMEL